jgi:hypothetical protein
LNAERRFDQPRRSRQEPAERALEFGERQGSEIAAIEPQVLHR